MWNKFYTLTKKTTSLKFQRKDPLNGIFGSTNPRWISASIRRINV